MAVWEVGEVPENERMGGGVRTYFVLSMYAGDWNRRGGTAFIRGVHSKGKAEHEAEFMQEKAGGQAANVVFIAMEAERAKRFYKVFA